MEDLEPKLRALLERLQGIPKTDHERAYLESLIIQIVSAKQIKDKVERAYNRLENLNTLLSTGEHLEALKWLEGNPLPKINLMSDSRKVDYPEELLVIGREIVKLLDAEARPTPIEVWAFLRGVYLGINTENPIETYKIVTLQALATSSEVLNAGDN